MIDTLLTGAVEIHEAQQDFIADGKSYPAGSFVVLMAQPNKAFAWALLDKQKYPDLRQYPGGPPIQPYDNAAWTLPLQMGVACDPIDKPFETPLRRIDKAPSLPVSGDFAGKAYAVLDSRINASYAVTFALFKEKAEIWRTTAGAAPDGVGIPAGSFLVKLSPGIQKVLPDLLKKYNLPATGLEALPDIPKSPIRNPRIALYQSWKDNMDEGWTRYMLEDMGIPYATIRNQDFKTIKSKKADLKALYDIIIFADENEDVIKTGKPKPDSEYARFYTPLPPEYEGGIEADGVTALKAFVEDGGMLVTLNAACGLVFKEFQPPARNILDRMDKTAFFCPTSILRLDVDKATPIGYGFPEKVPAVFSDSPVIETWIPSAEWDRKVVASYAENDVLLSGWLMGEDVIARKAAVVDLKWKKGRIVLIGIRAQHRAQSHGTYKFLLNALLYPES